jgi:acetylornithine deacetylase/succinyl-diaminopimelate desuccinylase-like protein
MSNSLEQFKEWAKKSRDEIRSDYFHFLKFPSISADPAYAKDVETCAEWLRDYIEKKTGMRAECIETEGYPLVYAEDLRAGPDAPTVLVYGHYDVQPVDPLELWKSDPFTPTERNGLVYARGAVDDKGQIFYAVMAARCWKELGRKLPINLKFCIEGEEESSSVGLSKSLPKLKDRLQSDSLLVVDCGQLDKETPALSMGCRGLVALEVTLTGSNSDLHSGMHGGLAYNPNRALAELLAKLWDRKGHVQVKGFYDDVLEITENDLKKFSFRFDKREYGEEFGIHALGGEKERTPFEANCFRPTLEINGMHGGYLGAGVKTVIPAHAVAKITCRLVPNQDPEKIGRQLADFLKQNAEPGMKVKVDLLGGERAFRGNPDSPLAKAVAMAATEVCGKKCENTLSGGSIPIIAKIIEATRADVVGMGYGLPEDNIHAPNESFDMKRFEKGFLTVARTLELL